ncbi:hypothetical protein GF373_17575 [bacterium]|nr:hypothetical protein [bacterium]
MLTEFSEETKDMLLDRIADEPLPKIKEERECFITFLRQRATTVHSKKVGKQAAVHSLLVNLEAQHGRLREYLHVACHLDGNKVEKMEGNIRVTVGQIRLKKSQIASTEEQLDDIHDRIEQTKELLELIHYLEVMAGDN